MNNKQVISSAEAVATANEVAQREGIYAHPVRLQVEEEVTADGIPLWRIHYLPVMPAGVFSRGGDYTVDVNAQDGSVYRTLIGQ